MKRSLLYICIVIHGMCIVMNILTLAFEVYIVSGLT